MHESFSSKVYSNQGRISMKLVPNPSILLCPDVTPLGKYSPVFPNHYNVHVRVIVEVISTIPTCLVDSKKLFPTIQYSFSKFKLGVTINRTHLEAYLSLPPIPISELKCLTYQITSLNKSQHSRSTMTGRTIVTCTYSTWLLIIQQYGFPSVHTTYQLSINLPSPTINDTCV
jgi:hypothetical protein